MKRFWLSLVITGLILAVCVFALVKIVTVSDQMLDSLEQISTAIEQNKTDQILDLAGEFQTEWENNERILIKYIHHDELDSITGTVARLKALAQYRDYSELSAEVAKLKHLVRHVCESQMPVFKNIC